MRARVTGVEAEVWLYPPCTGGRALPWLSNQEGRLQQSAMSPTADARFVIYFTKQVERTNFFGWVCLLFFNKHLVNYKIPSMVSVVALWHVQQTMRARVTAVQADMWLSWAWTGGRALPWLANQEGKLQQSAAMSTARYVIYYRKWVERTNFFDWVCLLFFIVNKHLINCKFPRMVSVGAPWHMQQTMWARVTGVQAEVCMSAAWTGGRALPWLPNQEGKLQQSTMSAARFVIIIESGLKGPTYSLIGVLGMPPILRWYKHLVNCKFPSMAVNCQWKHYFHHFNIYYSIT